MKKVSDETSKNFAIKLMICKKLVMRLGYVEKSY